MGEEACTIARKMVVDNYKVVQRWTRKEDMFSKKIVVFPVNLQNHWFSVIVVNPAALLE